MRLSYVSCPKVGRCIKLQTEVVYCEKRENLVLVHSGSVDSTLHQPKSNLPILLEVVNRKNISWCAL
jgi:hypothetical protein